MSLEKAKKTYEAIAEKCRANPDDKTAMADKAKAFADVRNHERELARQGDDRTPSKRAMQQEYIRRFPQEVQDKVRKRVFGK